MPGLFYQIRRFGKKGTYPGCESLRESKDEEGGKELRRRIE